MNLLLENGERLLLESGDNIIVETNLPSIYDINSGSSINVNSKSVCVLGSLLGDNLVFTNNPDFSSSTVVQPQTILYAFSTMIIFDFVQGDLEIGSIYAFSENESGRNFEGFLVAFAVETIPISTVAHDAAETLTSQFCDADKTHGLLEALLSPFDEIDSAVQYLNESASFLHGASGTWLDGEGKIIGAKRDAFSTPENLFFTFAGPREGGSIQKSYTQGFDCGYLRSLYGNELQGTQVSDIDYTVSLKAKALATFKDTSLCDVEDFVYNLYGVICRAEFDEFSDVILYFSTSLSWAQKSIIQKYAPISAGSDIRIVEL